MLLANIRFGMRLMLRHPGFGVAAVGVISLGIGATTAVFTFIRAVLLTPLPYPDPGRLVTIQAQAPALQRRSALTMAEFHALRERTDLFDSVATANSSEGNLTGVDDMEAVVAASVSDNLLQTLGVTPAVGVQVSNREHLADGRVQGVNVSYELWQRRWRGDPEIVGRSVEINNRQMTIVGVLPAGLRVYLGSVSALPPQVDIWFPGAPDVGVNNRAVPTIARLRQGVTLGSAQAALDAWIPTFMSENPASYSFTGPVALSVTSLHDDVARESRPALLALGGAVGFVMLIACANLGNLLLARTMSRRRELAVRAAIGASRGRIVIQLATEAAALASAGIVGGLLIAQWTIDALKSLAPASLPRQELIGIDISIALFAVAVSFGTTIVAGLLAAWLATGRHAWNAVMRGEMESSGRTRAARTGLGAGQIAVSLVLLVAAGLLVRTFVNYRNVPLGFNPAGVLTMQVQLPVSVFDNVEKRLAFFDAALENVRQIGGVRHAGLGFPLPLAGIRFFEQVAVAGGEARTVSASIASPGYLESLEVPLRSGRYLDRADLRRDIFAVILDEMLAGQLFGTSDVLGQRLLLGRGREATVVGVSAPVRNVALRGEPTPHIWVPYSANAFTGMTLTVRAEGDPMRLATVVKEAVERLGPGRPIRRIRPLSDNVAAATADARFALFVIGAFAVMAVALAMVGVYGIAAHAVERRRREIAVRLALGANASRVMTLVLREGAILTGCGVVAGTAASLAVTRYLNTLLFEVSSRDAITFAAVAALIASAAIAATAVPSIRAVRTDPMKTLRAD
jgi:putative ABC transport system permease protein